MQKNRPNKATCIAKLCIVLCAFFVISAVLYYFNYLHNATEAECTSWGVWYNFTSPVIAIANIIAFIGLTMAIIFGENSQHEQREKIHIADNILTKLYQIEKELAEMEKELRSVAPDMPVVYSAYLVLYRARYYFGTLHTIDTLSEKEKSEAKDLRDAFADVEREIAASYSEHKNTNTPFTLDEGKHFSKGLNRLTAMLNMMEADMMQQMAKTIGGEAFELTNS